MAGHTNQVLVTEFRSSFPSPFPLTPRLADQALTATASSQQSAAFNTRTTLIRVFVVDAAVHTSIGGTDPVATHSAMVMAAGACEYFAVKPGDKFAALLAG